MMELEKRSFEVYIERPSTKEVRDTSDKFEVYVSALNLSDEERRRVSDLKSDHGAACKKEGFLSGHRAAWELVKQIMFLCFRNGGG